MENLSFFQDFLKIELINFIGSKYGGETKCRKRILNFILFNSTTRTTKLPTTCDGIKPIYTLKYSIENHNNEFGYKIINSGISVTFVA